MKWALKIIIIVLAGLSFRPTFAMPADTTPNAPLQISLLTCGPGTEVYELYGHTAIRIKDTSKAEDWVFNYGMFDFDTPNFIWKFIKGQTDYTLGVVSTSYFISSYSQCHRYVHEQILNLTTTEAQRLKESLISNWQETDWTYRYNFLYDNCTTRAIRMIENAISTNADNQIIWPTLEHQTELPTIRKVLHEFSQKSHPWECFGQDLLLGSEIDQPASTSALMFSPIYTELFLDAAYIQEKNTGVQRPLVKEKRALNQIPETTQSQKSDILFSPMTNMVLLLLVTIFLGIWEWKKKKVAFIFDYLLMLFLGITGCITTLLFFFSEHPAVDTNWLIILLNPLPLLFLPIKVLADKKGHSSGYKKLLGLELISFIGASLWSGQVFPNEIYLLAVILLLRLLSNPNKSFWDIKGGFQFKITK